MIIDNFYVNSSSSLVSYYYFVLLLLLLFFFPFLLYFLRTIDVMIIATPATAAAAPTATVVGPTHGGNSDVADETDDDNFSGTIDPNHSATDVKSISYPPMETTVVFVDAVVDILPSLEAAAAAAPDDDDGDPSNFIRFLVVMLVSSFFV